MTYEQALRICAEVHRENGQEDIAEIFDESANIEAQRKYYANPENPQSFEDWLRKRKDAILT